MDLVAYIVIMYISIIMIMIVDTVSYHDNDSYIVDTIRYHDDNSYYHHSINVEVLYSVCPTV